MPTKAKTKSRKTTQKTAKKPATKAASKAAKPASKTSKSVASMITTLQVGLAFVFLIQAVVILILSNSKSLPVTTNFLTRDSLASNGGPTVLVAATRHLFDVNLAYFVAAILAVAAVAHTIIGTIYRQTYQADLSRGLNKARWIKTGVVETLIMVLIAMLVGVYDLSTLFMIVALNAVASVTAFYVEVRRPTDVNAKWLLRDIGFKAVVAPWVVFGIYVAGGFLYGSNLPGYIYGVVLSMGALFIAYGFNISRQRQGQGRWADYLFGERLAVVISFVAISALAWQIFFGVLK